MKDLYNLIDQQLLSLLMTWNQIHDDLMDTSYYMPDALKELALNGEKPPIMIRYYADVEMLGSIELLARKLISSAETAGLITLSDWSVMNAMICSIGLDDPDTAADTWWRWRHDQ